MRWFHGKLEPEDGQWLTEIFLFENLISGPVVRVGILRLLNRIYDCHLDLELVETKDRIREIVIEGIRNHSARIDNLVEQYRNNPEEYFPRTPVDALVYWNDAHRPVAIHRIKRIRRVTEKVSRRVADHLYGQIKAEATRLAKIRAAFYNIPVSKLVSSPEEMAQDFNEAERRVGARFQKGQVAFNPDDMQVNDVIGLKLVGREEVLKRAEEVLASFSEVNIVKRKVLDGRYNAIHLHLDLKVPPAELIIMATEGLDWSRMGGRGIKTEELPERFKNYVHSAAPNFRGELILTTYDEFVESELGRSIHESHILRYRKTRRYSGRIAKNAEFITEYMIALAFSPQIQITDLPCKLWGHYLPETLSYSIRQLYGQVEMGILNRQLVPRPSRKLRIVG